MFRGAWVAQSFKGLTSGQVMISRSVSSSPASGSVLTAQSLEPVSDSVSPSLSGPPHSCSVSLCLKNKINFKKIKMFSHQHMWQIGHSLQKGKQTLSLMAVSQHLCPKHLGVWGLLHLLWTLNLSSWPTLTLGRKSKSKRRNWCSQKKRNSRSPWNELGVHLVKYYWAVIKNKVGLYIHERYRLKKSKLGNTIDSLIITSTYLKKRGVPGWLS